MNLNNLDPLLADELKDFPLPRPNATVWKFFKTEFFRDLLETSELYLRQVALYPDLAEGRMNQHQLAALENHYENKPDLIEQLKHFHERVRQRSWVCCFSATEFEPAHMWNGFCDGDEGVAIKTTFANLERSRFEVKNPREAFTSLVTYDESPYMPFKVGYLLFRKLREFEKERELRLAVSLLGEQMDRQHCDRQFIKLPIKLPRLIKTIYLHPKASETYAQKIRNLVTRHLPSRVNRIRWSSFRRSPGKTEEPLKRPPAALM
ncbi:MAG: hypothetical protein ACK4UN_02370 [Limisphaerales bacterium]